MRILEERYLQGTNYFTASEDPDAEEVASFVRPFRKEYPGFKLAMGFNKHHMASIIEELIHEKIAVAQGNGETAVIRMPTGNTPLKDEDGLPGVYDLLAERDDVDWSRVIIFMLDEYGGTSFDYHLYIYENFIKSLEELNKKLPKVYCLVDPKSTWPIDKIKGYEKKIEEFRKKGVLSVSPEEYSEVFDAEIKKARPGGPHKAHVGFGGLGKALYAGSRKFKGVHIAFNEEGSLPNERTRRTELSPRTIYSNHDDPGIRLQTGLSAREIEYLGIEGIKDALKKGRIPKAYANTTGMYELSEETETIIFAANGKSKIPSVDVVVFDEESPDNPAVYMRKHDDSYLVIDSDAASKRLGDLFLEQGDNTSLAWEKWFKQLEKVPTKDEYRYSEGNYDISIRAINLEQYKKSEFLQEKSMSVFLVIRVFFDDEPAGFVVLYPEKGRKYCLEMIQKKTRQFLGKGKHKWTPIPWPDSVENIINEIEGTTDELGLMKRDVRFHPVTFLQLERYIGHIYFDMLIQRTAPIKAFHSVLTTIQQMSPHLTARSLERHLVEKMGYSSLAHISQVYPLYTETADWAFKRYRELRQDGMPIMFSFDKVLLELKDKVDDKYVTPANLQTLLDFFGVAEVMHIARCHQLWQFTKIVNYDVLKKTKESGMSYKKIMSELKKNLEGIFSDVKAKDELRKALALVTYKNLEDLTTFLKTGPRAKVTVGEVEEVLWLYIETSTGKKVPVLPQERVTYLSTLKRAYLPRASDLVEVLEVGKDTISNFVKQYPNRLRTRGRGMAEAIAHEVNLTELIMARKQNIVNQSI
jgi:6-phosphogluconolactonase/glucosamine-6-phosphate isomerase/deaminase